MVLSQRGEFFEFATRLGKFIAIGKHNMYSTVFMNVPMEQPNHNFFS